MEFKMIFAVILSLCVCLCFVDTTNTRDVADSADSQVDLFRRLLFTDSTHWTRTTTPSCPYPCTHLGQHYCHPLACHIDCVDGMKPPGGCCYVCPNGPTCSWNGIVIKQGEFFTMPSGQEVHCISGDIYGGKTEIRNTTATM